MLGVCRQLRSTWFGYLEEDDFPSKFRSRDQQSFEREKFVRQPFGVVEAIDSEHELRLLRNLEPTPNDGAAATARGCLEQRPVGPFDGGWVSTDEGAMTAIRHDVRVAIHMSVKHTYHGIEKISAIFSCLTS